MRITIILLLLCGCATKQKPIEQPKLQTIDLTKHDTIQIVKGPRALKKLHIRQKLKASNQDLLPDNSLAKNKDKIEEGLQSDDGAKILTNIITMPKKPLTKRDISPNHYESHQEWTEAMDNRNPNSKKRSPKLSISILDIFKKE